MRIICQLPWIQKIFLAVPHVITMILNGKVLNLIIASTPSLNLTYTNFNALQWDGSEWIWGPLSWWSFHSFLRTPPLPQSGDKHPFRMEALIFTCDFGDPGRLEVTNNSAALHFFICYLSSKVLFIGLHFLRNMP